MEKPKRHLILNLIAFFFSMIVIIMSACSMGGVESNAQLIGLIAGSFGAGATLNNTIRDYAARRGAGKHK